MYMCMYMYVHVCTKPCSSFQKAECPKDVYVHVCTTLTSQSHLSLGKLDGVRLATDREGVEVVLHGVVPAAAIHL